LSLEFRQNDPHESPKSPFSLLTLDRLIAEFQNSSLIYARLRELTTDLHDRITDELNETAFWQISTQDKPLFVANVFGERASAAFPSMNFDMEESAKCLGLDRPTASVFHLMRLMEASLRIIVREMNMPGVVVTNPSWDTILKKIDDELHKTYQHKLPAWRSREQFFAEVAAHLRTIKTAWRNPTMHVEKKYTPEEARGIFNAVRAFILHLATEVNSDQP
jgi:hypothetical protein